MNEAVVTAFSAVSPFGSKRSEFKTKMFAGLSGVSDLSAISQDPRFPIHCAGLLPRGVYPALEDNCYAEETRCVLRLLLEDLFNEELGMDAIFDEIILGTNEGMAKFESISRFSETCGDIDLSYLEPDLGLRYVIDTLRQRDQFRGDLSQTVLCVSTCVTGHMAIGYAMQRVQLGLAKRILVISQECRLRVEDFLRLNALGALTRATCPPHQASRPFAQSRSGFVRGEGAGAIVVESRPYAERRHAPIYASLLGYGFTTDAWRLTDAREDLKCAERAIERALAMAHLPASQIDYINAHGTSTPKNDFLETQLMKKIFGERAYEIPMSSLKSQIGHLNTACGVVEVIACLLMLQEQRISPTINYFDKDPDCDLYYVPNHSEARGLKYILKNGFGFGGTNAALILGRCD